MGDGSPRGAWVDWNEAEDARIRSEAATRAALQRDDGLTLKKALQEYVENKRRAKDGLALKARTRSDYLAMVEPARTTEKGTRQAAGSLHSARARARIRAASAHAAASLSSPGPSPSRSPTRRLQTCLPATSARPTRRQARSPCAEPPMRCKCCARCFAGTASSWPTTRWAGKPPAATGSRSPKIALDRGLQLRIAPVAPAGARVQLGRGRCGAALTFTLRTEGLQREGIDEGGEADRRRTGCGISTRPTSSSARPARHRRSRAAGRLAGTAIRWRVWVSQAGSGIRASRLRMPTSVRTIRAGRPRYARRREDRPGCRSAACSLRPTGAAGCPARKPFTHPFTRIRDGAVPPGS
jgi:hypothetical protein